jgi:FemAB-related protein (PEP-CTERM system-associated)
VKAPVLTLAGTRAVTVRDDAPVDASERYVAAHPHASAYHRRVWLDVVQAAFGHRTQYLAAESGGDVVGVLPLVHFRSRLFGRFTVSMPFFNYGGVLADTPDVERALLARAIEETRAAGGSHLELRHARQHFGDLTPKRHKVAMLLRLAPTVDLQWTALDRKVRNQVRKAEKSGLLVEHGGAELLPDFYAVFARHMRDLGTPVYGSRFFREVMRSRPDARVFLVRLDGRPVAASLVHWHGDTMEVPWASALRECSPLCANVFLYWQMVRFAIGRGVRTFDLGRSTPGEGTWQFKKQWGAESRELVWEYWTADGVPVPALSPANPKFSLAIRAWQHLPVRVATALGPAIVRNIP